MAGIKSLMKDTAIYGMSSIIGRFLNWLLVPMYTYVFPTQEYGTVSYIYSFVALTLIVLTYGMETGFFRFANHERYPDPMKVYSTTLMSLACSSTLFIVAVTLLVGPLSEVLRCPAHPSFVWLMGATVAIDAFTAIPFSYLRFRKRPWRFATLRLLNIGLNIALNLFFILMCPWLMKVAPGTISWFYDPTYGVGYVFLANFISSVFTLLTLVPELLGFRYTFVPKLWREMIVYSYPLLVLGIAGIMNQNLGTILLPYLVSDPADALRQVGIYGANLKVAIVMVMFTQAFRFAYEPFIFAQNKARGDDRNQAYRDAMKYFCIFAMVIFLGVMFYLDILKHFIAPAYFVGLKVVPVIMIAELFFGVFFNLSLWYKLTDKTIWGMWFSLLGLVITIAGNVLLVPRIGYMGCAWAALACYGTMMVVSYFVGRVKHPIGYQTGRICFYFIMGLALYGISLLPPFTTGVAWRDMLLRTPLLLLYVYLIVRREHIPLLNRRN